MRCQRNSIATASRSRYNASKTRAVHRRCAGEGRASHPHLAYRLPRFMARELDRVPILDQEESVWPADTTRGAATRAAVRATTRVTARATARATARTAAVAATATRAR